MYVLLTAASSRQLRECTVLPKALTHLLHVTARLAHGHIYTCTQKMNKIMKI